MQQRKGLQHTLDILDSVCYNLHRQRIFSNVQNKLRDVFVQMGISNADANMLADSVSYSEQGMQDDGRVSLDAFDVADYLRKFNSVLA